MTKLIKNRDGNFTHVKNDIFDSGLSAKAMGLFCYLWHLPDDWKFYEDEITKHFKDGKASIRSGLKELQDHKFLVRKQIHDKKTGKITNYDWQLNESPLCDYPKVDNPRVDNPILENRTLQSTNNTKYESNKILSGSSSKVSETSENPYELYRQMTGFTLTGLQQPKMMDFIKTDGTELVVSALKTAEYIAKQSDSKPSYNLFDRVMHEWESNGIKTVDQAREYEKKRMESKEQWKKQRKQAFYGRPVIDRKMPESMKEKYDPEKDKLSDKDKASLEKELEEFYKRAEE